MAQEPRDSAAGAAPRDPLLEGTRSRRRQEYAIFLPLLGCFLLLPPILNLFVSLRTLAGVPVIVIYVFGVWAVLIVFAARLARLLRPLDETNDP